MINQDSYPRQSPPSVYRPEVGLALVPRDRLPWLRSRYEELVRALSASPAAAYFHGISAQIDSRLQQGEPA
jgi:hypothetical protein